MYIHRKVACKKWFELACRGAGRFSYNHSPYLGCTPNAERRAQCPMPYSEIQQKHLSIWPHFTGALSMLGSGLIIYQILSCPKKRKLAYHRLLLAMSINDFITSFWYSLSTWPIPAGTPNLYGPSGSQAFCAAQGFFVQLGIATPLFNAALAFHYLFTIRYRWKEQEKKMKRAQRYFIAVPLIWGLGTAFAGLGMKMYNNANLWCWISSVPNQGLYRWIFFYGPLWIAIFLSGVAMLLTYQVVARTERTSSKWEGGFAKRLSNIYQTPMAGTRNFKTKKEDQNRRLKMKKDKKKDGKRSKQVSTQAFYYLMAFFFSWTPATLTRLIQLVFSRKYYSLLLLMAIFTPMQGFLNFLVYMRPRWLAYRKKHPEWGLCMAFAMIFRGEFPTTTETRSRVSSTATNGNGKRKIISSFRRKSSGSIASGRGSIDVGAPMVSEECKEEEVSPEVKFGCGDEEEHFSDVEIGNEIVVRKGIHSGCIPVTEETHVHFADEDADVAQ